MARKKKNRASSIAALSGHAPGSMRGMMSAYL